MALSSKTTRVFDCVQLAGTAGRRPSYGGSLLVTLTVSAHCSGGFRMNSIKNPSLYFPFSPLNTLREVLWAEECVYYQILIHGLFRMSERRRFALKNWEVPSRTGLLNDCRSFKIFDDNYVCLLLSSAAVFCCCLLPSSAAVFCRPLRPSKLTGLEEG